MIFCDMDGVLVDFDSEFEKNHGILPYKLPREELWQIVLDTENYWVNLPKLKDADIQTLLKSKLMQRKHKLGLKMAQLQQKQQKLFL